MLDLVLDLIGGALFLGQAVYFLFVTANSSVPDPTDPKHTHSS